LKGIQEKCKGKITIVKTPEEADAVILIMGLNHWPGNDSEGSDRKSFSLPQKQIDLINSTVKINPKTIVVLINGSPIAMDGWLENVPSVLEAWYPGMEGGSALADILFGDITPSGKLPLTFPKKLSDSPAHASERTFPGIFIESHEPDPNHPNHKWKDRKVYYEEGIYIGYRHFDTKKVEPLFPFGFGLSYTTFKLENLKMNKKTITMDDKLVATLDITNTGKRNGAEVVQLYIQDVQCSLERPIKELKGFQKVALKPGEKKTISLDITNKDLQFYNDKSHQWMAEKGKFRLLIGTSSRDINFGEEFELV
jgi:beta-glucosidase